MNAKTLKKHRQLISEYGLKRLMEFTGMTRQAIGFWGKRGIPRAWLAALAGLPKQDTRD